MNCTFHTHAATPRIELPFYLSSLYHNLFDLSTICTHFCANGTIKSILKEKIASRGKILPWEAEPKFTPLWHILPQEA